MNTCRIHLHRLQKTNDINKKLLCIKLQDEYKNTALYRVITSGDKITSQRYRSFIPDFLLTLELQMGGKYPQSTLSCVTFLSQKI